MERLPTEERDDFVPICPHGDKQIEHIMARRTNSTLLSKRLVYCCPVCRKVLGVSDRHKPWWQR